MVRKTIHRMIKNFMMKSQAKNTYNRRSWLYESFFKDDKAKMCVNIVACVVRSL